MREGLAPTGSVISKIWGTLTFKEARAKEHEKARVTNALRDEAIALIQHKGATAVSGEHDLVDTAAYFPYGTRDCEFRNFIAHLPNHYFDDIWEALIETHIAQFPEDQLLTDDHITVSKSLSHAFVNASDYEEDLFKPGHGTKAIDEHRQTMYYAMQHIEDGPLIIHMLYDRKIGTLAEMLEMLPILKSSSHSILTEGML